ncbi:MAG TPA: hypothetical protein VFQ84_09195 [Arenimonas sp.]|uniref:hypothetical protein n=1 Tax=Arenimonas sp. TaxID=1872635 RepID=UPI002D7F5A03|nr:hypothetical protein [Arenimonas sp.]HEU0153506.1 hypothetical protein [Arenimonas sp.]
MAHGHQLGNAEGPVPPTRGFVADYPLATALLGWEQEDVSSLQRTLAWLALELQLTQGHDELVEALGEWLRGIRTGGKGNISWPLGDCNGLPSLVGRIASLGGQSADGKAVIGHGGFDRAWRNGLREAVQSLLSSTTPVIGEDGGTSPLSGPSAVPVTFGPGGGEDPDDDPIEVWEPVRGNPEHFPVLARKAKALSSELCGRGIKELVRSPDSIFPSAMAKLLWETVVRGAEQSLTDHDLEAAQCRVATLLALEAGVADGEVGSVAFGRQTNGVLLALDVENSVLRRPEARPPGSFDPKANLAGEWAAVGGDVLMPLSQKLIEMASSLLAAREASGDPNRTLLILGSKDPRKVLATTIKEVWPGSSLSTGSFRQRIVAGLVAELGPDAAQLAFGETFGGSAAPTYYAGHTAGSLLRCVERLNAPMVGVQAGGDRPAVEADYLLGSRARPTREPYAAAWERLGKAAKRARGRPRAGELLQLLRAQRDCLAVHFILCTGQRPTQRVAEFRLADLLPAAAMALVRDKQSDPARLTRLVATGRRFIGAVEAYVASLKKIRRSQELAHARGVVTQILRSELPLFCTVLDDGSVARLDMPELCNRLPGPWREKQNLHRHGLNLALTRAGVDPELRYFQMGWIASDVHAVSDASPYPPRSLGPELAPIIDGWLLSVGWEGGMVPKAPDSILDMHPLRSFDRAKMEHDNEHRGRIQALKEDLASRREEVLPKVIDTLARAFEQEKLPLQLEQGKGPRQWRLARTTNDAKPILAEHVIDGLLAPFEERDPIQRHLAARVLTTLLRRAAKTGVCRVEYLPRLVHMGPAGDPSPFIPGIGLATTHADALRQALLGVVSALNKGSTDGRARTLAILTVLAIAAHTRHRKLAEALRVACALPGATASLRKPWLLRLPFGHGHIAASGVIALLCSRICALPESAVALNELAASQGEGIGRFLLDRMPSLCGSLQPKQALDYMFETLQVAGAVELEGPQRLLSQGILVPATVTAMRAASSDDEVTIGEVASEGSGPQTGPDEEDDAPSLTRRIRKSGRPTPALRMNLKKIMELFNPDYQGKISGKEAKPAEHRHHQLLPLVSGELEEQDAVPCVTRVVMEFVHHLMTQRKGKKRLGLEIQTIYGKYNRLTRVIAAVPAKQDMSQMTEEHVTACLLVALEGEDPNVRADQLAEAADFLQFAQLRHGVSSPDWLRVKLLFDGGKMQGHDPAVMTDTEVTRLVAVLAANASPAGDHQNDPVEQRLRELQLAAALLMESSSARPRSVYGLTLGDIHLFPQADYIHLKTSGPFASVKTRTSAGFIRLEGPLWQEHRPWFVRWHDVMLSRSDKASIHQIPLFQKPNAPHGVRFPLYAVTSRISDLAKWATGQANGRSYWLRKRRIQHRHASVKGSARPLARDVGRAMRASGHAQISTPIASYLADPTTYANPEGAVGLAPSRVEIAHYGGLSLNRLDQRWHRVAKRNSGDLHPGRRLAAAIKIAAAHWEGGTWGDPPNYRPYQSELSWTSVGKVIPGLLMCGEDFEAIETFAEQAGMGVTTVRSILDAGRDLCLRLRIPAERRSEFLRAPRNTAVACRLKEMVKREDSRLQRIAREWVDYALVQPQDNGCVLFKESTIDQLVEALESIGFGASRRPSNEGATVVTPTFGAKVTYGAWPGLRWALSVAWIVDRLAQPE